MNEVETEMQSLRMAVIQSYIESEENEAAALVVVLAEALSGPPLSAIELAAETNAALREIKASCLPTIVSEESRLYRFSWSRIITFMVMDELHGHLPRGESTGRWLKRFSSSPFLEFARSGLFYFDDRPLLHARIGAIDRHVDVLSDVEPTIERIR